MSRGCLWPLDTATARTTTPRVSWPRSGVVGRCWFVHLALLPPLLLNALCISWFYLLPLSCLPVNGPDRIQWSWVFCLSGSIDNFNCSAKNNFVPSHYTDNGISLIEFPYASKSSNKIWLGKYGFTSSHGWYNNIHRESEGIVQTIVELPLEWLTPFYVPWVQKSDLVVHRNGCMHIMLLSSRGPESYTTCTAQTLYFRSNKNEKLFWKSFLTFVKISVYA